MTSLFPSYWNVPDSERHESRSERPVIGYSIVDGAAAVHTLSAQLLSMHGQT